MRLSLAFGIAIACAAPALTQGRTAAYTTESSSLSTSFSVDQATAVPGQILKPGTYSIEVVDHLSDRIILEIADAHGKVRSTLLAVPSAGMTRVGSGPVEWQGGGQTRHAMRGFLFPGGSAVEFVYPKAEAAAIAKRNAQQVPAIDPAADNSNLARKHLSATDLQMLSLWSLSMTHVGPNDKTFAIAAKPYQANVAQKSVSVLSPTPSTLIAANEIPRVPAITPATRRGPARAVPQKRKASDENVLPSTASSLPLLAAIGMLLLTMWAALLTKRMFLTRLCCKP